MDQISPIKEATSLAGTAWQFTAIASPNFFIVDLIFFALDDETLKRNERKSTMVPKAFMAWRGKNEHFSIFSESPSAAASKTIFIANFMACVGRACDFNDDGASMINAIYAECISRSGRTVSNDAIAASTSSM